MTAIRTHYATHAPHEDVAQRGDGRNSSTRHFIRHYVEMLVAMFAGMFVLGVPAGWALSAFGSSPSELQTDAPSLMLLGMAFTMTAPMVAWMRYRGHGWRANTEMAASMALPTFAAIVLVEAGVMDLDAVLLVEHAAMLVGMLVAMLLRLDEYTQHHGRGRTELAAA